MVLIVQADSASLNGAGMCLCAGILSVISRYPQSTTPGSHYSANGEKLSSPPESRSRGWRHDFSPLQLGDRRRSTRHDRPRRQAAHGKCSAEREQRISLDRELYVADAELAISLAQRLIADAAAGTDQPVCPCCHLGSE